jgi:hypothetical protein
MPKGPMSRQLPGLVLGAGVAAAVLTETEVPAIDTLAAAPEGPSVTPMPTSAVPAEILVVAATELAETDAAALTLTALPADTFAAADTPWPLVEEAPTETVATGVLTVPEVPGVPLVVSGAVADGLVVLEVVEVP